VADQGETGIQPVVSPVPDFPAPQEAAEAPVRIDVQSAIDPDTGLTVLNIELENVDAAVWGNYILRQEGITILDGTVNANVTLTTGEFVLGRPVDELLQTLTYRAELMLNNVRIDFDFLPGHVETVTGRVSVENQVAFFDRVRGTYQGSPVTIYGNIINFENPALNLLVQAPSIQLEQIHDEPLFPTAPIASRGSVNATIYITGRVNNPIIKGDVGFQQVQLDGRIFTNGDIVFKYFSNMVTIDINRVNWQQGTFSGSAFINFEGRIPAFAINLRGENANAGELARELFPGANIDARSDFDVNVLGTTQDPLVFGESNFYEIYYNGLYANQGEANFLFFDNLLLVLGLRLNIQGGRLFSPRTMIDFEREYINSTILGTNLTVPAAVSPELAGATGDFAAFIAGRFADPVIAGCISNAAFNISRADIRNISGCFLYAQNTVYLSDISALINSTGVNFTGWYRNGLRADGEFAYRIGNFSPAALTVVIPGAFNIPLVSTIDIRGNLNVNDGLYNWNLLGAGALGNVASYGSYEAPTGQINGSFAGWNFGLGEFIPPDTREIVNPGRGSIIVTASGTINNLGLSFVASTPQGEVIGLPMTFTRGDLTIRDNVLVIHDSFLAGVVRARETGQDERLRATENLYKLTTYWGADIHRDNIHNSTLARMYYAPYTLERYAYTSNSWYVDAFGPVTKTNWNPLQGSYQAVLGLPEKFDVPRHYMLKRIGDGGFPLQVDIKEKCPRKTARYAEIRNVLDFSASGTVNLATGALDLTTEALTALDYAGRNIRLEPFKVDSTPIHEFTRDMNLAGTLFVSGQVGRTIQNPVFQGKLNVPAGRISGETFTLEAEMRAAAERVELRRMLARINSSEYQASGFIIPSPEPFVDFNIQARQARLRQIFAFVTWEDIPASGNLNADVRLRGTPRRLTIDGRVLIDDAVIYGQPVNHLTLALSSDTNITRVDELTAVINGGVITGSGFLRNNTIDFRLTTEAFPLRNIQALRNRFPGITGQVDLGAVVTGTLENPVIDLDFVTRNFTIRDHTFEIFRGSLNWRNQLLTIQNITLQNAMSYWNLGGTLNFGEPDVIINLQSELVNWPVSTILALTGSPLLNQFTGTLNGNIAITNTLLSPHLFARLNAADGRIGDVDYNRIELDAGVTDSGIDINRLALTTADAWANISGSLNPGENLLNLAIAINNLPARIFRPFADILREFDGRIFADGTISGALNTPDMRLNVNVVNGRIGFINFDSLGGLILASAGVVTLQDFALRKDNALVTIEGTIPLEIRDGRLVNVAPLEIAAFVQEQSLEIIGLFIPAIESATGRVSAVLRVTGLYPDLDVQGSIQARNGIVNLTFMQNPITNLHADIEFTGKEFVIQTLRGNLGEGLFNLTGFARLDQQRFAIESMRFVLLGANLLVVIPDLITGRLDTKVTLTGSSENPFIGVVRVEEGRDFLTINNATLTFPVGQIQSFGEIIRGEADEPAGIELPEIRNFMFTLGQNVWFDFQGFFAQTTGTLLVHREENQSLRFFGELHVERGSLRLPFLLRPFIVITGTAFFDGGQPVFDEQGQIIDYRINPYFELQARTRVGGFEIFTIFEGRLDELQTAFAGNPGTGSGPGLALGSGSGTGANIVLYSNPPLSRQEIMALLVGETFVGSLVDGTIPPGQRREVEGAAVNVLTGFLQELILGDISRALERTLQLTEIYFRYHPQGMMTIEVARAIDAQERLYITYTRTKGIFNLVREIWGIEYKYLPNLRFRLETTEGAVIPSIRGVIEFDTFGELFTRLVDMITFRRPRDARPGMPNYIPDGPQDPSVPAPAPIPYPEPPRPREQLPQPPE
jgi:autotransporter translocation and assembly factor TamB